MCPACITTLAIAAAGTGSAGGLTALLVRMFRRKKASREAASARTPPTSKEQP